MHCVTNSVTLQIAQEFVGIEWLFMLCSSCYLWCLWFGYCTPTVSGVCWESPVSCCPKWFLQLDGQPQEGSVIQCNVTEFVTLSDNRYKVFLTGNKPCFRFCFDVGQCFTLVGCARGGASGSVSSQLVAGLARWIPWTATKTSSRTCPSVRACALRPQHGWTRRR